jgi:phospholipase/lecithinase/hemolysin
MAMRNFLLTLHIFGAIAGFGVSFSFPIIGAMAQKPGSPILWALQLNHNLGKWLEVFAATVVPGSGAGLIITQHVSPWQSQNRWLLAALIIYVVAFSYANFVQNPGVKKAIGMAEAQQFGPEFGAQMKKLARGGQLLTVFLITIIILMVVKP